MLFILQVSILSEQKSFFKDFYNDESFYAREISLETFFSGQMTELFFPITMNIAMKINKKSS